MSTPRKNYSHNRIVALVDAICAKVPAGTTPLNLSEVKKNPKHLMEAIGYRNALQEKECKGDLSLKQSGFCVSSIILAWLSGKNPKQHFLSIKLLMDYTPEQLIKDENAIELLAKIEFIQWTKYHTGVSQEDFPRLLNDNFNQRVNKTDSIYNKAFDAKSFVSQVEALKEGGLLLIGSVLPPTWDGKRNHAVGITRRAGKFYYFDANNEEGEEKEFSTENLSKIFDEELINSFYKIFNIPLPVKVSDHPFELPLNISIYEFPDPSPTPAPTSAPESESNCWCGLFGGGRKKKVKTASPDVKYHGIERDNHP